MFLNSFNHFRAIAIIFIVAAHGYDVAGVTFDMPLEFFIKNLTAGGTMLFVFISGFMFHHVFSHQYNFKKFICSKTKNLLIPYTVLAVLPIFLFVYTNNTSFDGYFLPQGVGVVDEYLIPSFKYYWTGRFLTAYWYIPCIMLTFLISPLHILFIKLNFKVQVFITLLFFLGASLVHRPIANLNVLQSLFYFTPVYLLGILCSQNRDCIYGTFSGKEMGLLLTVLALASIQAAIGDYGNYHKDAFEYAGFDLVLFQKALLCIFFMVWLRRFENVNAKYIQLLASTSFAVFFLHAYLLRVVNMAIKFTGYSMSMAWVAYCLLVLLLLLLSVCIALIVKKLLPKYSRYLTGY